MKKLTEHFGSREGMLGYMLIQLSMFEQECDVTFYNRNPILGVRVSKAIGAAMMYGAGAKRLKTMLENIEFSDGTSASLTEFWTVNPMPKGGPSKQKLNAIRRSITDP